jgi:cell division septal protein FtsQ
MQNKRTRLIIILAAVGIIILALAGYLLSDYSRVYRVNIRNNRFVSDNEIRDLASVEEGDVFLFVFPAKVEEDIRKNPLIESVTVKKDKYKIVNIDVKERLIIGYTIIDNGICLIDCDANSYPLADNRLDLLDKIPYLDNIDQETLALIAPYFKDVDQDVLSEISDISIFPLSYDENSMMMITRDANYLFLSKEALGLLDKYHGIASNLEESKNCIFFEEVSNSAYTSACPFVPVEEEPVEEPAEEEMTVETE